MHTQIKALRVAIASMQLTLDDIEASLSRTVLMRHADCVSPDLPPGFDTVLGYLAKCHPDVLDTFDYTEPAATQRDGFWLMHQARRRGYTTPHVVAPMVMQHAGIPSVRAYPVSLLAERWG